MVWGRAVDAKRLAALPRLRTLEVYHPGERDLPRLRALADLPLTALSLRRWPAPDLRALAPPEALESLTVWQSPKLVRLDGVENIRRLKLFCLNDNGPLASLEPISALARLETLVLSGGIWGKQAVDSLAGLAGNASLRKLVATGIKLKDPDLAPVAGLGKLRELDLWPRDHAMEEIAKVAAAHPFWLAKLLDLKDYPLADRIGQCRCGRRRKEMFLKGRKFLWCPACEKKGLDKLLENFRRAAAAARPAAAP